MLETFTPAVCGSRRRQTLAQALFAGAAVAAAAIVGLALGFAGSVLGARQAVLAAASLALLAAAREAGVLRLSLPQVRRQVPERWRFELPLPIWASGYGAGLGAGLLTYQPVSTFWIACAGALALARPLPAAFCLSFYGAGRALIVAWPRRAGDPTAAVERLSRRRRGLLRLNALTLVACASLLGVVPAADGAVRVAQNAYDPSWSSDVFAFARQGGGVVVRPSGEPTVAYPNARQPSVSRGYLAYVDRNGIRVVRWATGQEVARVSAPGAWRPALSWPLLAFVRRDGNRRRLVVRNLETGRKTTHASVRRRQDLGRPALRNGRLAWHVASRRRSLIKLETLATGRKRVVARSRIALLSNPALYRRRILWVEARSGVTRLKSSRVGRSRSHTVRTLRRRRVTYWTTTLGPGWAAWTRWALSTRRSDIYRAGV
jgi:hypothetical protein